jgi:D-alanyl-lipoteichoic acid acyltransferase DltB (MBOAT superfamily)
LAALLTFLFVNVAWVFFRAPDVSSALSLLKAMGSPVALSTARLAAPPYGLLLFAALLTWACPSSQKIALETRIAIHPAGAALAGAMIAMSIFTLNTAAPSPFLYFNF